MRRISFDIWKLDANLCEEIKQAFNEGEELLLVIEDYDSESVKVNSYGLTLTRTFKEGIFSTYKYEGSEYEKVVWIDQDDHRKVEVSLQLYGYVELAEIDCEQDLGDITLYVKIQKRRDPVVCV